MDVHYDRAIFEMQVYVFPYIRFCTVYSEALHIQSPFYISVGHASPALPADGKFLAIYHNIELNVFAATVVFPGVLTVFHVE